MYVTCLEVLSGIEEGAPELPLFHGHNAASVQHGQELRELPDLEERRGSALYHGQELRNFQI